MNDATGSPQSALFLGATSDIARQVMLRMVGRRARRLFLAGRDRAILDSVAAEARAAGADTVETLTIDASVPDTVVKAVGRSFEGGDLDLVLIAFGVLGDQEADESDPATVADRVTVNFTSAAAAGAEAARRMRDQGHGTIVVLSSTAAERPRRSVFVYGAAKAGLDAFFQGLADSLVGTGVRVVVVRPGFVRTRMTTHLKPAPLSTTPEAVADLVVRSLERRQETVWAPPAMRWVMVVLRHLPRPVFRRLPI
ncbi:MAG TPA: decaprenylphospho-beta-D-erythro-pentofuranosid-2-ulose 2-reductase [Acidimicrobiales bacterium]|nr:decaprenylphospho-beta-D-erythro-pentofuranosid-2-ulose 2-reductase [Acidimicrobiales bacterium]